MSAEPLVDPSMAAAHGDHTLPSDHHDAAIPIAGADGSHTLTRDAEDDVLEQQCWTPADALRRPYFAVNTLIGATINFVLNGVIGYALMHKYDEAGLWEQPRTPHPYTSIVASDLFITTLLVVFFTTLLTTGGIQTEIKKGMLRPVTDASLRDSYWRLLPTRFKSPYTRAALNALLYAAVYYGFTLLLLATICLAGGMGGQGNVCVAPTRDYPWLKAMWAFVLALTVWPNAYLGHLNKANLPQDVYDLFLARQKLENPHLFAPKHILAQVLASGPISVPTGADALLPVNGGGGDGGAAVAASVGSNAGGHAFVSHTGGINAGSAGGGGANAFVSVTSVASSYRSVNGGGEVGSAPKKDRFRKGQKTNVK